MCVWFFLSKLGGKERHFSVYQDIPKKEKAVFFYSNFHAILNYGNTRYQEKLLIFQNRNIKQI